MTAPVDRDQFVQVDEAELIRAHMYGLLGKLLGQPPSQSTLDDVSRLEGDDTPMGAAIDALAIGARGAREADVAREYNALFIGLGRGALLPYGSYYLTGFLNEKPLAVLRNHMAMLGIVRADNVSEPEDHIASLCEIMAAQISGEFGPPVTLGDQEAFFNTHLAQWAGHFFADLEAAKQARFYAPVGRMGRLFMNIEIEGFRMLR
ncbi:MAG: molecular chaperone TorD family protein [Pseudomonadota bacterium]